MVRSFKEGKQTIFPKLAEINWNDGLLHKLRCYGISGRISDSIQSFFFLIVKWKFSWTTTPSDGFHINAEVHHGSIFASTLFLIIIKDLPDVTSSRLVIPLLDWFDKFKTTADLKNDPHSVVNRGKNFLLILTSTKQKFCFNCLRKHFSLHQFISFRLLINAFHLYKLDRLYWIYC